MIDPPGAEGYITGSRGIPLEVISFEVFEVPRFIPSGHGQHFWGLLEKWGRNTFDVVGEIAAGVDAKEIGYAGLKDRKGRTFQWISSPVPFPPAGRGFRFWVVKRSGKKLKVGNLLGNWFRIKFEGRPGMGRVLKELRATGVPNFFGPQRFSHSNHRIGELLIRGKKDEAKALMRKSRIPFTRRYFRLMEDAYCSYLFNKVLSRRLGTGVMDGDVLSRFGPTGPVFGRKLRLASGVPGEIERDVLREEGLSLKDFPGKGRRRALTVPIDPHYKAGVLRFFLPKGSYATAVLREITKSRGIKWSVTFSSSCA